MLFLFSTCRVCCPVDGSDYTFFTYIQHHTYQVIHFIYIPALFFKLFVCVACWRGIPGELRSLRLCTAGSVSLSLLLTVMRLPVVYMPSAPSAPNVLTFVGAWQRAFIALFRFVQQYSHLPPPPPSLLFLSFFRK